MKPRPRPLPTHDEAIEAMAAAWLAQRDEGLSAEEQQDFERWRQADPKHAAAVSRLERTWTALQQLRDFRPESRVHPDHDLLAVRPSARVLPFFTAAAAGLAAAAVFFAVVNWWPQPDAAALAPQELVYTTMAEGYQRVKLEDNSVLELNASSEVRVQYQPAERRVRLMRGEAHFTVAKNPQRAFVVQAGGVSVRAIGTAFNVRFGADDAIEVIVTEGRVKVERDSPGQEIDGALSELNAGERLLVARRAPTDREPAQPEVLPSGLLEKALAWQGPRLRFAETPLASVLAQFNQHNLIQMELGDPDLATVPVDGSFRSENVEAFIRLIESEGSIRADRVADNRIVLRRVP